MQVLQGKLEEKDRELVMAKEAALKMQKQMRQEAEDMRRRMAEEEASSKVPTLAFAVVSLTPHPNPALPFLPQGTHHRPRTTTSYHFGVGEPAVSS